MRLILFFFLISTIANAQAIKLGNFDELKVYDGIRVTIIPSKSDSLVVQGENKEYLTHKNKNGCLVLRMQLKKKLSGFNTTVALFSSKPLDIIDTNQGSFVSCEYPISQQSITLKSQEGSEINATLDVQKVTTKAVSGGIISIKGAALIQSHKINTGGILEAQSLDSDQVEVAVKMGGSADVKATELAEAEVAFGGSIYIYGKPKKIIKRVSFGGSISEKTQK